MEAKHEHSPTTPPPVAKITYYEEHFELGATCPFCNRGDFESLQYTDYVEKMPMLWCGWCGAMSVLDMSLDDVWNLYDEMIDEFYELSPEERKHQVKEVPLCFIEKIVNSQLDGLVISDPNEGVMSQERINEFLRETHKMECINGPRAGYEEPPTSEELAVCDRPGGCVYCDCARRHGLRKRMKGESVDFRLGIVVKSYDLCKPSIPFPEFFKSYDYADYMHIQFVNGSGERCDMYHWTD